MAVWAIADLHLALSLPNKAMDFFGEPWIRYTEKIKKNWTQLIGNEDLVLIAGDISWAVKLAEAKADLEWIGQLPGTKVAIRGNHDYWWSSLKQIETVLPSSIHLIQNNAFQWKQYCIGGARLWDTSEYNFKDYITYVENPRTKKLGKEDKTEEAEKIFQREIGRLEMSLGEMGEGERIVMTHYPPIGADMKDSAVSKILEKHRINYCVFGHLHNIKKGMKLFGQKNGITYLLTSADYLDFTPLKICD